MEEFSSLECIPSPQVSRSASIVTSTILRTAVGVAANANERLLADQA